MKKWKTIMCLAGACAITFSAPLSAMAALSDYDAETAARLSDNRLDFDELQNLIKEYNPQMKNAYHMLDVTRDDTASTVREINNDITNSKYRDQLKGLRQSLKQIESLPDSAIKAEKLQQVKSGIAGLQMILDIPSTTNKSTDKGLKSAEKQLDTTTRQISIGVQKIMIAYDSLSAQVTTLKKVEELQKASLEASKLSQSVGLATATDVNAAESSLLGTQSQLDSLRNMTDNFRSQLCLLTGWSADARPEIGPVPAADPGRIDTIDFQADLVKAIGNNQSLISQRHSSSEKSSAAVNNRLMNLDESEQKLKIEMERLYQDMKQKRIEYDAATTAYQKAEIANNAAAKQYQMGMLGKVQYIGTQVQFLQAQSSMKAADTALLQAMLDYDWGVLGFASITD